MMDNLPAAPGGRQHQRECFAQVTARVIVWLGASVGWPEITHLCQLLTKRLQEVDRSNAAQQSANSTTEGAAACPEHLSMDLAYERVSLWLQGALDELTNRQWQTPRDRCQPTAFAVATRQYGYCM